MVTDKVLYKPNDVMFIEVLLFDAFNYTLILDSEITQFFEQMEFYLEIHDPSDNIIYNSTTMAYNSSVGFTFKVPSEINGG